MALYSGIAGLELGLKLAVPGYRTVCYVEREAYSAAITVKLMEEKILDEAVVWDDAETFDGTAWRGKVDIISAGFPCQPVSVAGKRQGHKDKRWQWPTVRRIICEVRPRFVFLENPPGIFPWVPRITASLTEIGYLGCYGVFPAAGCGAPQEGKRWFLVASDDSRQCQSEGMFADFGGRSENTSRGVHNQTTSAELGKARSQGLEVRQSVTKDLAKECTPLERTSDRLFPPAREGEDEEWDRVLEEDPALEPALCKLAHGVPFRVDRLRALGNAVVPVVAAKAWRILLASLFEAGMIDV